MGLLKHIRSRSKIKNSSNEYDAYQAQSWRHATGARRNLDPTAKYPRELLQYLFTFVCPHTCDEALAPLEECMTDWYGCLLCVYRDLGKSLKLTFEHRTTKSGVAHCSQVSRHWSDAAQSLL